MRDFSSCLGFHCLSTHPFLHVCNFFPPASFNFTMHNFICKLIRFVFFAYINLFGCYQHLVKITKVNNAFRSVFSEKIGDMVNTYFPHCTFTL